MSYFVPHIDDRRFHDEDPETVGISNPGLESGELSRDDHGRWTDDSGEHLPADPEGPEQWCNSARVVLDRNDDSVTVTISVGDPRGAFAMSVRRSPDGRMFLHVPHPDDSFPHAQLAERGPGNYEIG